MSSLRYNCSRQQSPIIHEKPTVVKIAAIIKKAYEKAM